MSFTSKIRGLNRKRINLTRNFLLKTVIFLFDTHKNKLKTVADDAPILVLRSDGKIGDTIISTGFFRELKKNAPHSKIYVVGNEQVKSIFSHLPYVDEIIVYKKGFLNTLKVFFKLRRYQFKFILNSTDEIKPHAAFLQGQLQAGEKFVFLIDKLRSTTKVIRHEAGQLHFSNLYESTLKELIPNKTFNISYEINIEEEALIRVKTILQERGLANKKLVTFNAFAGTRLRSFSFDTSLRILNYLLKDPELYVVTLAPPHEVKNLQKWRSQAISLLSQEELNRWVILNELKSLDESFALIKSSDLLITPDTSLVHAACAFGIKLVCVYRQRQDYKNSIAWGPRWNKAEVRVIHAVSDDHKFWDVNLLKFEEVEAAIREVLAEKYAVPFGKTERVL